jgi:hypothetical protein
MGFVRRIIGLISRMSFVSRTRDGGILDEMNGLQIDGLQIDGRSRPIHVKSFILSWYLIEDLEDSPEVSECQRVDFE